MLKIYGRNTINMQKVMWLIDELAIKHEFIPAGGEFGGLDTPEFLAMNPHGRIPVIKDGETVVWESQAILRYLAARYGAGKFWSTDPAVQAQADQWMDWSTTVLQPDFIVGVYLNFYRTPEAQRDWNSIQQSIERTNKHFLLLNNVLKNRPYLAGNTITLADVPAGTMLYRYFNLAIERPTLSHVEAWYKHLQERPAYRKQVMVAF